MQCNKCGRIAVFFQEYSGQHLCKYHFNADVEAKAKYEIRRHRWMTPGDHIGIALSGDKPSSALLYFMKKLSSDRRDIRISAISIDEGITGYRDLGYAKRIADLLDTECIMGSFQEFFGITTDEITQLKGTARACMYCRVLRNFLLNRIAREHGITKLAFGYTLDDRALSVLKNVLQGVPELTVFSEGAAGGIIPRIRPFDSVPKKEVAFYADFHINGCDHFRCPYHNNPFERDVSTMLNDFTIHHPATKYALQSLENNLAGAGFSLTESVHICEQCGEPTEGLCQSCLIIHEVTAHGT